MEEGGGVQEGEVWRRGKCAGGERGVQEGEVCRRGWCAGGGGV